MNLTKQLYKKFYQKWRIEKFHIIDHQIHYWEKIGKAAFKSFAIMSTSHWMRFGNIFSCLIYHLLPSISMIESVFLFSKKQWQLYLSCTMVNTNDIVFDRTKNSIQPIESVIILRVIYLLIYYCDSIFQNIECCFTICI